MIWVIMPPTSGATVTWRTAWSVPTPDRNFATGLASAVATLIGVGGGRYFIIAAVPALSD